MSMVGPMVVDDNNTRVNGGKESQGAKRRLESQGPGGPRRAKEPGAWRQELISKLSFY